MKRREFLSTVGAAAILSPALKAQQAAAPAMVLYDGRAIALDRVSPNPKQPDALWIQAARRCSAVKPW